MKIGFVDLDTSHPRRYLPILRGMGHDVTGVYDAGDVHPEGYAAEFAREHGVAHVFRSLEEMAEQVDTAFVMGCNWDRHVERSRPFVEREKAVFLDKPIAGNASDLATFQQWADSGARLTGGSGLRYVEETAAFLAMETEDRGELHTLFCGCAVDEFNYGIHAFSHALGYLTSPIREVRFLGQGGQKLAEIACENGCRALISFGSQTASLPFHASLVTHRKVFHTIVDNSRIYDSALAAVMPYLAGSVGEPPVPFSQLIEAEKCALLTLASEQAGGAWMRLDRDLDDSTSFDGEGFCASYRLSRYPASAELLAH